MISSTTARARPAQHRRQRRRRNANQQQLRDGPCDARLVGHARGAARGRPAGRDAVAELRVLDAVDRRLPRPLPGRRHRVLAGRWFLTPDGGRSRVGLIAQILGAGAGGRLPGQTRSSPPNPTQSPAHNATDQTTATRRAARTAGESSLGASLFGAAQLYLNDLDDRRHVRFSAGVSQQERYVAERHVGASATLTWRAGATAIGDVSVSGAATPSARTTAASATTRSSACAARRHATSSSTSTCRARSCRR